MQSLTVNIPMQWLDDQLPEHASECLNQSYVPQLVAGRPNASTQSVLRGRETLTPMLDLNDFKCKAVIDWVEFEMHTIQLHQAVNIQRHADAVLKRLGSLSTISVLGPNGERGHVGYSFRVRVQQPCSTEVMSLVEQMLIKRRTRCTDKMFLPLLGVELSVDFYPLKKFLSSVEGATNRRLLMTDMIRRHLRPSSALTEEEMSNPRFYAGGASGGKTHFFVSTNSIPSAAICSEARRVNLGLPSVCALEKSSHKASPINTTSYIGSRSPILLRVMDKTTDNRDPVSGTFTNLKLGKRRSRLEVSFHDGFGAGSPMAALDLAHLGALWGFEYHSLRKTAFEFFLPTRSAPGRSDDVLGAVNDLETEIFTQSGVYGLDRFHRAYSLLQRQRYKKGLLKHRPSELGTKGHLLSYTHLNQKVDRALRRLSRSWSEPQNTK